MAVSKYADAVRRRLNSSSNQEGAPLSVRKAARKIAISYEHLRRIAGGEGLPGRAVNDRLCKFLNLDPTEMWNLARIEKRHRKYGDTDEEGVPQDLRVLWRLLSDEEKE